MNYDEEKFSRPESNPNILASTSQIDLYQSLDDILEGLKKTLNDIPPPKCSRKEIFSKWEFIKGIRKEDILELVKKINNLSNNEIHEKVKEIEQVAYRLDLEQAQEYNEGDKMKIMKR
jgi:predicted HAD superfamily phosphohydrolase